MPTKVNLMDRRFGRLTVVSESGRDQRGGVLWRCECECGRTTLVKSTSLVQGKTKSCGCGVRIAASQPRTHGQSDTELYRRWQAMKARCSNPNGKGFHNYGGRGIVVCPRWRSFENFMNDMGSSFLPSLELERINIHGNYEPSNCTWISHATQQRNKRSNHPVVINGVSKTLIEWSEETGIKANTILTRIRRGWPESRLLEVANERK